MFASDNTGFDAQIRFRAPADLMPLIQLAARRQGLTASSFMRSLLCRELERLGVSYADQDKSVA